MSLKYRDSSGTETPVAGLNGTSGELVPSVSLYQKGSQAFSCAANSWTTVDVTLNTPMPDNDYQVILDSGATAYVHVQNVMRKSTTGFVAIVYNRDSLSSEEGVLNWQAFKLMTDEVHEADSAHIAQNTANFAPAFSEVTSYAVGDYVTYGGALYKCTTAHTAGVWVAGHFTRVTVGGEIKSTAVTSISGITVKQQPATIEGCWMARSGNVVQLRVALSGASMTTASATTVKLTFPSYVPKPVMEVWSCNDHYNSDVDEVAALRFSTNGEMYLFTTKEHSPLTNATVNIGVVYLTNE